MATRSKPKNFGPSDPERGKPTQMSQTTGPWKAHPSGVRPPLPGAEQAKRAPDNVERYYMPWNNSNIRSNQQAESERLTAERLLQETKELIAETKLKTKQDAQEVDTRFKQRVGDIAFWKSELEGKLAEIKVRNLTWDFAIST